MDRIMNYNLNDKIGPLSINNDRVSNVDQTGKIIAAGPLSKQPMTRAYRIILVMLSEKDMARYVVWVQVFPDYPDLSCPFVEDGDYYMGDEDIVEATETFADRVKNHADYLGSLLKED